MPLHADLVGGLWIDKQPGCLECQFRVDHIVLEHRETECLEHLDYPLLLVLMRHGSGQADIGGILKSLQHRVVASHKFLLRNEAQAILNLIVIVIDVDIVDRNGCICLLVARYGVEESRLAGSRTSEQEHHVTLGDDHVDIFKKSNGLECRVCGSRIDVDGETFCILVGGDAGGLNFSLLVCREPVGLELG